MHSLDQLLGSHNRLVDLRNVLSQTVLKHKKAYKDLCLSSNINNLKQTANDVQLECSSCLSSTSNEIMPAKTCKNLLKTIETEQEIQALKLLIQKKKTFLCRRYIHANDALVLTHLEKNIRLLNFVAHETTQELENTRRQLLRQLLGLFPIKASANNNITMRGFKIPSLIDYISQAEDYVSSDIWTIGTSLGFVAHFGSLMAKYLDVPLKRRITINSSRTTIGELFPTGALLSTRLMISEKQNKSVVEPQTNLKVIYNLLEPIYYRKDESIPHHIVSSQEATFLLKRFEVTLYWTIGNTKVHNVFSRLKRSNKSTNSAAILTPSGLFFKKISSFKANSKRYPAVRPPLHPIAASSVYSNINYVPQLDLEKNEENTDVLLNEDSMLFKSSLFNINLQLLKSSSFLNSFGTKSTANDILQNALNGSPTSNKSITTKTETESDFPLYVKSSSVADRSKFSKGLKVLREAVHQLAWEYENRYIDEATRFRVYAINSKKDDILKNESEQRSNFDTSVRVVDIHESSKLPPQIGDSRWDNISLLQPFVFAASAAQRRGTGISFDQLENIEEYLYKK